MEEGKKLASCCACDQPVRCIADLAFYVDNDAEVHIMHADCGLAIVLMAFLFGDVTTLVMPKGRSGL